MKFLAATLTIVILVALTTGTSTAENNYHRAKRIVYAVFPNSTQGAAFRVVGCETGYTWSPRSYNPSGASGLFQILQSNAGRRLYGPPTWDSRSHLGIVIPSGKALFDPWINTFVAYFLSKGGRDWHEWTCQP